MSRRLFIIAAMLWFTAAAWAQKNQMNLYIWSEYIDPQIITNFEKQFDCKVTVDVYEDNESMVAKLQGGGSSLYDVVVPSDYILPTMLSQKLLAPLRKENVPNMKNINPKFASREYDVGNVYTVPYQWGTAGIYFRKAKGESIDPTWALMFDAKKQIGPFLMIDDMRTCIGAALRYKGYSVNTVDKQQLKEAFEVLVDAKKRSRGFEGGVGGKNKVLGKVCKAAMVYNGDAARGIEEDPSTYFFVPREGSEIWMDNLAVPAKAPHRLMAEKFINYILDPKVGAQLSNFNQYATPNLAAEPYVNAKDKSNPTIYPPPEVMKVLEFTKDLGSNLRLYDELWTEIKSK